MPGGIFQIKQLIYLRVKIIIISESRLSLRRAVFLGFVEALIPEHQECRKCENTGLIIGPVMTGYQTDRQRLRKHICYREPFCGDTRASSLLGNLAAVQEAQLNLVLPPSLTGLTGANENATVINKEMKKNRRQGQMTHLIKVDSF